MNAQNRGYFIRGARTALSPPGLVLFITFFAFGALVSGGGLPLSLGVGLTIFTFAIPGQVVLVDELARGGSLITAALVTAFSAIRLLPLSVSMMPVVRNENTPKWMELLIVHFVAVTVWVQSMKDLPALPREERASHCLGFCLGLLCLTICSTIIGFHAAHLLPTPVSAATLMVTPIYFFLSLLGTSISLSEKLAFALGTIIAIPLVFIAADFALIISGLVGGTLAYLMGRRGS